MAMSDFVVCWLKVREALSKSPRSSAACRYAAMLRARTTRCVPPARRDVLGLEGGGKGHMERRKRCDKKKKYSHSKVRGKMVEYQHTYSSLSLRRCLSLLNTSFRSWDLITHKKKVT